MDGEVKLETRDYETTKRCLEDEEKISINFTLAPVYVTL